MVRVTKGPKESGSSGIYVYSQSNQSIIAILSKVVVDSCNPPTHDFPGIVTLRFFLQYKHLLLCAAVEECG